MDRFSGQWIGHYNGTNNGLAVLDLDFEASRLIGSVYAFDNDESLPNSCAPVSLVPEGDTLEIDVVPEALHPKRPEFLQQDEIEGSVPNKLSVQLKLEGDKLSGRWSTDIDTRGEVKLERSKASSASSYVPEEGTISWKSFQSAVGELAVEPNRFIFRGQPAPWRLRTSFHRTSRKDLWRYWNEDIPRVRHASVGTTSHLFDPNIPDQNGAFLHLLQHHGYPTPMLDWTYSPYIAAFFAYYSFNIDTHNTQPLRIFMFDAKKWRADFNQVLHITLCQPHFSLLEPPALGNTRALPQQSVAAITNIDDIETYISSKEQSLSKKYLRVFDLDPTECKDALRQLGLMGISPGSMFPGIDGVCREYRDRHFGYGS